MKVGLVCPYNVFLSGGVQECVFALQKELTGRGHEVKIITPLPRGAPAKPPKGVLFIGNAARVKSFHTTSQFSAAPNTSRIETMLATERFDVLHFHEPWVPFTSMQILNYSTSANVATFHAKLPETVMNRTIERVITPYTRSIMKYLDGLSAVSDSAAEYVRSLTDQPISIIPNGVDLQQYRDVSRESRAQSSPLKAHRTKSPKVILYIGRLEKRKGVAYLLKAYEQLARKRSDVALVIAGEGVDRVKLEASVRENAIPRVSFKGYVTQAQKIRLLRGSDLFCSPAPYGESFGIVLLEAMASGLVTVAGDNSGYAGVLRERGALSLVNPKDTKQFARRMELLLCDEELRELWRAWALEYVKQFSYAAIADQYENLYRAACGQKT